jgi:hypothetical protein
MPEKVFITDDNTATFSCPKCKRHKTTDVTKYKNIETSVRVKIKCPCGHAYDVILERRRYIRKNINLTGKFIDLKNDEAGGMTVTDISRYGLRLRLKFQHTFDVGDKLLLDFTLDDKQKSFVANKEVIVRSVKGVSVGAEFAQTEHYDSLGPYLLYYMK